METIENTLVKGHNRTHEEAREVIRELKAAAGYLIEDGASDCDLEELCFDYLNFVPNSFSFLYDQPELEDGWIAI